MYLLEESTYTLYEVNHILNVARCHANWPTACIHLWQSRVDYSVVYFDRITAFKVLAQNFHKGWGSYTLHRLIRYWCIFAAHISGSFALQRFKCGNAVKLRNGIMFHFYPGLPHMYVLQYIQSLYWSNYIHHWAPSSTPPQCSHYSWRYRAHMWFMMCC